MRIGELADAVGTTTKTLRFYEEHGLLPEAERTPSGYRDYSPEAVTRIDFIHRGKAAGLTLAQIRQILLIRDRGQAPCEHVRDLLDTRLADLHEQISKLVALHDTIAQLRNQAATPDPTTCTDEQVCRYL
ncbi:heavy metal-responsive transcriptional regulator [Mycobacterium helveticum]|uniref:Heavy metal-responsive transcriptional regulator n=1 Tax=Mycobacterium helveticum TaxID=2592811 RepID=A0A557XW25_9MYCO|nr:heavy metal-responsive transcriptional regulator [Mycobacterium helveticum]TVS86193.1 heavy metal-responsive transcriptional regulator [Mycobacterium helveticum]TVS90212.1 heavy metal-responsive transcriptional regulator [Mycobacterium helveticum]